MYASSATRPVGFCNSAPGGGDGDAYGPFGRRADLSSEADAACIGKPVLQPQSGPTCSRHEERSSSYCSADLRCSNSSRWRYPLCKGHGTRHSS
ncbi:unnamed protein product [Cuscuta campestris]|uniref:Uncharacterized protein n=1 Tax=Cuscuta campestris TaxID=132261 RepID=A0A484M716_9ASTE|nr:unnamed protein product [Cuscuta campestris]